MGLSPVEFWDLSWYEWGLYINRLHRIIDRRKEEVDEARLHTGILWATLLNIHNSQVKGAKNDYKPSDLFKTAGDTEPQEDFDFDKLVNRFGRRIKKKNG